MTRQPDQAHLDYATKEHRVLYSFNVGDFCRLHTEYLFAGKTHAGIVLSQQRHYSVGEQMRRLVRLLNELTREEMANRLEFLNAWGDASK